MILPERVFGRILIKSISRGANPGAEPLTHVAVNIVAQFIGLLVALVQGDECLHDLHCQVVRFADHPGSGNRLVFDQRALAFEGLTRCPTVLIMSLSRPKNQK